ncbi:Ctr copper transporter [Favolaschia claudopus]|uniref:Copper transport protein n=1 Tax=Favolaschia claudopus TaxID=2862362 RepID=A0AAV9ZH72_9AGAR
MDSMSGMDMNSTTPSSDHDMSMMMMKSYLHFTSGDVVLFDTIAPSTPGTVFATCLVFFLVSVGDRYLRAVTRGVERRFAERLYRLAGGSEGERSANDSETHLPGPSSRPTTSKPNNGVLMPTSSNRFVPSHEFSRGALAGLQSTIHYTLMLVVMTFNVSYIISVVLGVVVGEIAFGRLNH